MTDVPEGMLLVVSGPSGVGKGTIIGQVRQEYPDIQLSVSCTTRLPRAGERDGEDYRFITDSQFQQMRQSGELLEWAQVHDRHYYGTPREPVEEAIAAGRTVVLEIDYQGAWSVREQLGEEAVLVFVAPPSWQALVDRLRKRHTESQQAIEERLVSACEEIGHMGIYDYVVINDKLSEAVKQLASIIVAEGHSMPRFDWQRLRDELLAQSHRSIRGQEI